MEAEMTYKRVVAQRTGSPEVLEFVEEPLRAPAGGEARIRVLRAGVAFGELMWQSGKVPGGPTPPFTPGYDLVGVVDAVGPDVEGIEVGETVAALMPYGGYTEVAYLPAQQLVPVPAGLNPSLVVCLTMNYVAGYQLFHRIGKLEPGQRVLVHGAAGAVGTAMLELGRLGGLEMYGTASLPQHDLVRKLGGVPIDYQKEDFVIRVKVMTKDGVDMVVDHIGGSHLARSLRTLRTGGHLIATSSYNAVQGKMGPVEMVLGFLRLPLWNLLPNGRSAMLFDIVSYNQENPDYYKEDLTALMGDLAAGQLKPIIAAEFPLSEARRAQEMVLQAQARGKVVLVVGED
jgi:NADPH2:quinone reductase